MPPPTPPNVANMPHDVADFVVSVTLSPNVDDDRAAKLSGELTERAAEWLVLNVDRMHEYVTMRLDDDELKATAIVLGPKPLIAETRSRLEERATYRSGSR